MNWDIQVVLITGATSGYGLGMAQVLSEKGATVWITGRNEEKLKEVSLDLKVKTISADVTKPADWDRVFERVLAEDQKIDILINNAGAGLAIQELCDMKDSDIEEVISVNLTGAIFGCSRAAKQMKKQKSGTIINISSICQKEAWPAWSVYSAAKAGLAQLSNCLYTELRPHGVKVTNLIPSWGATDFNSNAGIGSFDQETADKAIQPKEIGELVAQVCELPVHLVLQELTLLPLVQAIEPL